MRILHYFLGPERQGGLNRYVRDLSAAQAAAGHHVMLLYPCGSLFPPVRPLIRHVGSRCGVECFQLLGGLPVPLLEGIRQPEMILESLRLLTEEQMCAFISRTRPEVLHVHTWMGFPRELLEVMRARGVRVVFTTHDYFGLCPKVNLVDDAGCPCTDGSDARCSRCNLGAPGERFLSLRNSMVLMRLKGVLAPLLRLRQRLRRTSGAKGGGLQPCPVRDYASLREYYLEMLRQCDCIHCNSRVAHRVYASFLPNGKFRVLPITHGGMDWRPADKEVKASEICLGFSGPEAAFKGLPMLLGVLAGLESLPWHLEVWGTNRRESVGRVTYCGRYRQAERALGQLDLLIVPSVWNETFGFIVAEALSLGVPVLCSDTVGAQSLVEDSMVYHGREGLERRLTELLAHPEELQEIRRRLVRGQAPMVSIQQHAEEMVKLYGELNGSVV